MGRACYRAWTPESCAVTSQPRVRAGNPYGRRSSRLICARNTRSRADLALQRFWADQGCGDLRSPPTWRSRPAPSIRRPRCGRSAPGAGASRPMCGRRGGRRTGPLWRRAQPAAALLSVSGLDPEAVPAGHPGPVSVRVARLRIGVGSKAPGDVVSVEDGWESRRWAPGAHLQECWCELRHGGL